MNIDKLATQLNEIREIEGERIDHQAEILDLIQRLEEASRAITEPEIKKDVDRILSEFISTLKALHVATGRFITAYSGVLDELKQK